MIEKYEYKSGYIYATPLDVPLSPFEQKWNKGGGEYFTQFAAVQELMQTKAPMQLRLSHCDKDKSLLVSDQYPNIRLQLNTALPVAMIDNRSLTASFTIKDYFPNTHTFIVSRDGELRPKDIFNTLAQRIAMSQLVTAVVTNVKDDKAHLLIDVPVDGDNGPIHNSYKTLISANDLLFPAHLLKPCTRIKAYINAINHDACTIWLSQLRCPLGLKPVPYDGGLNLQPGHRAQVVPYTFLKAKNTVVGVVVDYQGYRGMVRIHSLGGVYNAMNNITLGRPIECIYNGVDEYQNILWLPAAKAQEAATPATPSEKNNNVDTLDKLDTLDNIEKVEDIDNIDAAAAAPTLAEIEAKADMPFSEGECATMVVTESHTGCCRGHIGDCEAEVSVVDRGCLPVGTQVAVRVLRYNPNRRTVQCDFFVENAAPPQLQPNQLRVRIAAQNEKGAYAVAAGGRCFFILNTGLGGKYAQPQYASLLGKMLPLPTDVAYTAAFNTNRHGVVYTALERDVPDYSVPLYNTTVKGTIIDTVCNNGSLHFVVDLGDWMGRVDMDFLTWRYTGDLLDQINSNPPQLDFKAFGYYRGEANKLRLTRLTFERVELSCGVVYRGTIIGSTPDTVLVQLDKGYKVSIPMADAQQHPQLFSAHSNTIKTGMHVSVRYLGCDIKTAVISAQLAD